MHTPVSLTVSPASEKAAPKVNGVRIRRAKGGFIVHNEHDMPMESEAEPMVLTKLSHVKKHLDSCFPPDEDKE